MENRLLKEYEKLNIRTLEAVYEFNRYTHERVPDEIRAKNDQILRLLVKKYFEDKHSFPIYKRLLKWIDGWNLRMDQNTAGFVFRIIQTELQGNDLPKEYLADFFRLLLLGMDYIDKKLEETNGSMDWDFSQYPQLYVYLSMLEDGSVDSVSLRARINELSEKITKRREEQKNTSLPAAAEPALPTCRFKKFKLKKSGMTKNAFVSALTVFGKYDESDQEWLMAQARKKNWEDLYDNIPTADMVNYLRTHTDLNLWEYIAGGGGFYWLNKVAKGLTGDPGKDRLDIASVRNAFHNLYMSYPGGTEEGFVAYWKRIAWEADQEAVRKDAIEVMRAVTFPMCDIMGLLETISYTRKSVCVKFPTMEHTNGGLMIRENLEDVVTAGRRVDLYYEAYEECRRWLDNPIFSKKNMEERARWEQDSTIRSFLTSPADTLLQAIEVYQSMDGVLMMTNPECHLKTFIRDAFCYGHRCIDRELAAGLFYDINSCERFLEYADQRLTFSGWFRSRDDYMEYFYDVLSTEWDFGDRTGFRHLLRFKFKDKKQMEKLIPKLGTENPRLAAVVKDLTQESRGNYCSINRILEAAYEDDYFFEKEPETRRIAEGQ